ncbi:MAG: glutamine-hydrolyzing GMP synthase [Spirochaetaceae bacterium]|jgi:GMP synthase (glutamine-hydrolysing)|nr:glutamine-hydrolyzing GMP synthase [Spirochaetaceae bacterium]
MDTMLILDFGSQTTQLIGRRIRDMGVYAEIIPGDASLADFGLADVRGIVLSGSPESVNAPGSPVPDKRVYACGLPLLGVCYGLQRMTADLGGTVASLPKSEYGGVPVTVHIPSAETLSEGETLFFAGFDKSVSLRMIQTRRSAETPPHRETQKTETLPPQSVSIAAWMSHGDTLTRLAPGFREYGHSGSGFPAVVAHESKPWYGLQFHPEAAHCERGTEILAGFVFGVCACKADWTMERYIETVRGGIAEKAGTHPVLLLISGGVDSAVAAGLLLKALPAEQVRLMYMDTGLMRKDETKAVETSLKRLGAGHIHIIHCEEAFLSALKGVSDPEIKRKTIGDLFIEIQEREVAKLGLPETYFLAQGTLYTDLVESGKGVGNKARVIKSHHNVGSPLVEAKRRAGRIIEPLDRLYKDEARRLGRLLGLDESLVRRHPFPGPGLAVRILGEVTRESCDILRRADALYLSELQRRGLYDAIWQAFAVLLPVRSVGVAGDARKYGRVLALRAITSADGMTADVYPFPAKDLLEIATLITNAVPEIGRVV